MGNSTDLEVRRTIKSTSRYASGYQTAGKKRHNVLGVEWVLENR
jgi:hypothetical protein